MAQKALLWNNDTGTGVNDNVKCNLCAHRCNIAPDKHGRCAVRVNNGGILYSSVYGHVVAQNIDPVEKKPLYHFLPGSETFSIATVGCNFRCSFCQNHSISQAGDRYFRNQNTGLLRYARNDKSNPAIIPEEPNDRHCEERSDEAIQNDLDSNDDITYTSPNTIVEAALRYKCKSVSFTYTEPTVFFEYALDTAMAAKAAGLRTVFVSNGFMTPECLKTAAPYLDACNIDLKSFRDEFYTEKCGARLAPVLETLKAIRDAGILLEVTTLLIGGLNDSDEELSDIAEFIVNDLGRDTPWHVSGFYPRYRMTDVPPTNAASIERACKIGIDSGLRYVYGGNVAVSQDTRCPNCGELLINRRGYKTQPLNLTADGTCGKCGEKIFGIFYL